MLLIYIVIIIYTCIMNILCIIEGRTSIDANEDIVLVS